MRDIVEVYLHWQSGSPIQAIARSLGIDRKTIRKYLQVAQAAGITPGQGLTPDEWVRFVQDRFPALLDPKARSNCYGELDTHRDLIREGLQTNRATTVWQRLCSQTGIEVSVSTMKFQSDWHNPLTRMKLRHQLLLLLVVLVSPVFLLTQYANFKAEQILKRHVTNAYLELNKQNYTIINRDIDTISQMMTTIILNPVTQRLNPKDGEPYDRVKLYETADKLLTSYSMDINGGEAVYYFLYVYDPEGLYSFAPHTSSEFKRGGVYFYDDRNMPAWIGEAVGLKRKGQLRILENFGPSPHPKTLGYVRAVNSMADGKTVIGVLVAANVDRKIEQSLQMVSLPDQGEIYVTDYGNRILAATEPRIGDILKLPAGLVTGDEPDGEADAVDSGYIYVEHHQYETQQKLIYKISTSSLLQQQNELKQAVRLISIVYLLFGFVVMMYFWRSLLTPLQKLAVFTRSYVPGKKFPQMSSTARNDEVGVLIHSVHGMAERLNALIEDRYLMEIKQKEAQLHLLYQQINPHLLYNTLESIYWKSSLEGRSEAAEMIKELAKLMRIGLSRGRELISLREELEHAKAYVSLQQMRYESGFQVKWDVDEAALEHVIPKITLQPLLENAMIHGVRNMGEDGVIEVAAIMEGGRIVIRVGNNGYKEPDFKLIERLLAEEQGGPPAGFGIRNVQQRIRLHFGAPHGLRYDRRTGGGTVVTITLPAMTSEEESGHVQHSDRG